MVRTLDGRVVLGSDDHHLHCVNYSQPFRGRVSRDELLAHLHSYPARPHAIPFKFYFYDEKWGLCLQHERVRALTDDEYDVEIDCAFEPGEFKVLSALLPASIRRIPALRQHLPSHAGQRFADRPGDE